MARRKSCEDVLLRNNYSEQLIDFPILTQKAAFFPKTTIGGFGKQLMYLHTTHPPHTHPPAHAHTHHTHKRRFPA
jgi:hypothetical protein